MTESALRSKVANWLAGYAGIAEGSTKHKEILNVFNNSGLCSRYKMTTSDPWCATAVSAAFIACGLAGKPGSGSLCEFVECYCDSVIAKAKTQGIWVENDAYKPSQGDVILYDWQDSGSGDNTGSTDHIGIVYSVSGSTIKVVEGNISNTVGYRTLAVNGRYIRGYITPKYSKFASGSTGSTATTSSVSTAASSVSAKTYRNGSTEETVYADPNFSTAIGSLNAYESCDCWGKIGNAYVVEYTLDNGGGKKVGFVQYAGGC